jgi:NitT/TauT family transport system substrate-binding protein
VRAQPALSYRFAIGLLAVGSLLASNLAVQAEEKLHFGKSIATLFHYTPIDVGLDRSIFKKHGLDVDTTSFAGDAKMQQALAAGSIDIGVGGGPTLAFIAKGAPVMGVAQEAGAPLAATLAVLASSPIKQIADFRGRLVSVSTVGGQTEWMTRELSRQQGWGMDGVRTIALGEVPSQLAALKTRQTDAIVAAIATAYRLIDAGEGRIVVKFGDVIPNYVNSVMFATNVLIEKHPEELRGFLAAWFETVAFMKKNKDETVKITANALKMPDAILGRVYDETFRMVSDDGRFDAKGLTVLSRSFVEMSMLAEEPDVSKLYTEKFLPVISR